jgi:hypothetical protein
VLGRDGAGMQAITLPNGAQFHPNRDKLVRNVATVGLTLFLAACDPVTYGEVVIDSEVPFDRQCLTRVQEQISDKEELEPQTAGGQARL